MAEDGFAFVMKILRVGSLVAKSDESGSAPGLSFSFSIKVDVERTRKDCGMMPNCTCRHNSAPMVAILNFPVPVTA